MQKKTWAIPCIAILTLVHYSCGSGDNVGTGTYAQKCEVACRLPSTTLYASCTEAEVLSCRKDCEVLTEGLATDCAQCLIENSGWESVPSQSSSADRGILRPDAGPPQCPGYEIEQSTSSKCRDLCK
jgi:hypothetical protein